MSIGWSVNFHDFVQTEASVSRSQGPAICSYSEPAWSSPPVTNLFNIHVIVVPSPPRSFNWSLSLRFPHRNSVCISSLPNMCHMSCLLHSSWLGFPNDIWWVHVRKLFVVQSSLIPYYLVPLGPKCLPHTMFSNCLRLCSVLNLRDQVSNPYKKKKQNYSPVGFNFYVFGYQTGRQKLL